MDHMTQPRNGFYNDNVSKLYIKYTAHVGSVINLKQGAVSDEERGFRQALPSLAQGLQRVYPK